MKPQKLGVVLLALLLAAMAIVPCVSAGKILSSQEIFSMEYLEDTQTLANMEKGIDRNTVSEYSLVTVNSKGFMNAADTDHIIAFSAGGKKYQLDLVEVPVPLDKNAKLLVRTEKGVSVEDIPKIKQYRAKIIGDEYGTAFFTVDDTVLLGKISVENKTYCIEQKGIDADGNSVHMVYDISKEITPKSPPSSDDIWLIQPLPGESVPVSQVSGNDKAVASTSTVNVMLVYDPEFQNAFPASPNAEVLNMLSEAGTAYSRSDVGVNLNAAVIIVESTFSNSNPPDLGQEFINRDSGYKTQYGCDLGFLATGKNMNGNLVGLGAMYTGLESSGYALAQMVPEPGSSYTASFSQRSMEVAHELGHNFGAAHDGGDPGSSGYPWYVPSWARPADWWFGFEHTVMYPTISDSVNMEFSTSQSVSGAHGDSTHDNAKRIRQTKANVAAFH